MSLSTKAEIEARIAKISSKLNVTDETFEVEVLVARSREAAKRPIVLQHRCVFKPISLDEQASELAWQEEPKSYEDERIRLRIKDEGWYKFRVATVTSEATEKFAQ